MWFGFCSRSLMLCKSNRTFPTFQCDNFVSTTGIETLKFLHLIYFKMKNTFTIQLNLCNFVVPKMFPHLKDFNLQNTIKEIKFSKYPQQLQHFMCIQLP